MTAGTNLTQQETADILTRLRKGVESHNQIAADLGLSRHTVHRIARVHGIPNQTARAALPPRGPDRTDTAWMEDAACRGVFGFTEMKVAEQQAFCAGCEVAEQCLQFGLAGPTPTVHWDRTSGPVHGGVSARDLRRLRKMQLERADLRQMQLERAS